MSQLLVMPINKAIITASYKSKGYRAGIGATHYGVDMYSNLNTIVYACGKGEVVCAGYDNVVGNTVAVIYRDVFADGAVRTVAVRCFHLRDIMVKKGQKVTKDTILGHWGSTGRYVKGAHLHIEVDKDYEHWQGIPGMTPAKSTFYYRGGDTMLDPAECLHPYSGDRQTIVWSTAKYNGMPYAEKHGFTPTDALIHDNKDYKSLYEKELSDHNKTKAALKESNAKKERAEKKIEESIKILEG